MRQLAAMRAIVLLSIIIAVNVAAQEGGYPDSRGFPR